LRQLLKTSGDVYDGRCLAADLMPGALTQDLTSVAITPERCSQQTESSWVDPAQAASCTGLPDHACGVWRLAVQSVAGVYGAG